MSKKLQPLGEKSTKRLQPLNLTKPTGAVSKDPLTQSVTRDQFYEDNLKDYDSLLNYCMKLIDENKQLLGENSTLRSENDEVLNLNLELLQENETLRKDKDKLVDDSLTVIDYNEQLLDDKTKHDKDYSGLLEKFKVAVSLLTPKAKTDLTTKHPKIFDIDDVKAPAAK